MPDDKLTATQAVVLSRRGLLKDGLTMAGGVAALAIPAGNALAASDAPATFRRTPSTRKFRAWVTRGGGRNRTTLQELTLRPIKGRQVVVRTEAASLCYFNVRAVLGLEPDVPANAVPPAMAERARQFAAMAIIQGHGGVGVVEAVGPEVRRVQAGDRVCVSGTPQCGVCYHCLRGRADMCQFLGPAQAPANLTAIAQMQDGTPVYANSEIGGLAELMVTQEEWVVPVTSKASAAELGMICSCVSVAGLGATTSHSLAQILPGSVAAVMGCGPLGLSAVQGARVAGASIVIAVDPIRARRELARKVGATHVFDPNVEGDSLIDKVKEISLATNTSLWGGGRNSGPGRGAGADFVVEAVGADWVAPKAEAGPDPTGVQPMMQAYDMCAAGGHFITTGVPRGMISYPAAAFSIGGRTHHAGQAGGSNPLRDIPRYVSLLDSGQFDVKSMLTSVVPFEKMLVAYEDVAYRTTVFAIMTI